MTTARIGRPRDPLATARTIAATQDLLATHGPSITVDAVVARAGVGKATIYRRWGAAEDLIAEAVLATDPLPAPPEPGCPTDQLRVLLCRLAEPLAPAERTVAVALALAPWDETLRRAAEQVLLEPLRARLRAAILAAQRPGTTAEQTTTAVELVEGLWLRRLVLGAPPMDPAQLEALRERILAAPARPTTDLADRRLL